MMHIRPIDQELDSHRVITIVEQDIDTALDGFHVNRATIPDGFVKMKNPQRRYSAPPSNWVSGDEDSSDLSLCLLLASSSSPTIESHHRHQSHRDCQTMIEFGSNSLPSRVLTHVLTDGLDNVRISSATLHTPTEHKLVFSHNKSDLSSQYSPKKGGNGW